MSELRFDLSGRVAIVTGASSGIGAAVALALAGAGARVAIGARRAERLEATRAAVEAAGAECLAVVTDIARVEDCRRLVAATVERFGRVDVLVNNAGVATSVPSTREEPDEFRRVIEVNVEGTYWMSQACARVMEPGSSIVNVGSVLGSTTFGLPQAAYAASKSALIGLTRDLAQQWTARKGIRVNTIAPGFVDTELLSEYPAGFVESLLPRVAAARVGTADEIVGPILFLASDAASYITGALIPVDGGLAD